MTIIYSDHAIKRMKQRGVTELEVEYVLEHPIYIKKSFEGRKVAAGEIKNKLIMVAFIEIEKDIKIVTIM
ncbi:MAG TPA: DUF4258 domain-containing protein [Candidatus Nanoarchaeia archaeon]|nr:DUF4258 domain-containing protein [Candidatus Nanoarchaeia archaeon]